MSDFLPGAVAMASLSVGLFFFRYWRRTGDRLFMSFGIAFWLLAVNWTLPSLGGPLAPLAHWFRFLAFFVIAVGVLDKNRRQGAER